MKKYIWMTFFLAFCMIIVPLLFISTQGKIDIIPLAEAETFITPLSSREILSSLAAENTTEKSKDTNKSENFENASATETISVFMPDDKKTVEMKMREYIIGVVAAEMPVAYEYEALCAQALASVTLARKLKEQGGNEDANGADIVADASYNQGYMETEEMRERWGDDFDSYYNKLCSAVDEVINKTITYNEKPALTVFHAISSGVTETSEAVWGLAVPYLINTKSEGDKLSPGYASDAKFTVKEFCSALDIDAESMPENTENWLGDTVYSDANTLISIKIGDKTYSGSDIRKAFSLRSSSVTIAYSDSAFVFTVNGYGHGVGMSQYGADYFARQGMTYEEIIAHYYPGTKIV